MQSHGIFTKVVQNQMQFVWLIKSYHGKARGTHVIMPSRLHPRQSAFGCFSFSLIFKIWRQYGHLGFHSSNNVIGIGKSALSSDCKIGSELKRGTQLFILSLFTISSCTYCRINQAFLFLNMSTIRIKRAIRWLPIKVLSVSLQSRSKNRIKVVSGTWDRPKC